MAAGVAFVKAAESRLAGDLVADFQTRRGRGGADFGDGAAELVADADGGGFFRERVRVGHGDEGGGGVFVELRVREEEG